MVPQADFLHCHQPGMVDNDRERRRERRGEREKGNRVGLGWSGRAREG